MPLIILLYFCLLTLFGETVRVGGRITHRQKGPQGDKQKKNGLVGKYCVSREILLVANTKTNIYLFLREGLLLVYGLSEIWNDAS